jgi:uncharacterized protein with PQ loop repeat
MFENLEPYPHPIKFKRYFDGLMYVVGSLAPLALLPQVIHLYVHKDATGLSITTWVLLGMINGLWVVYGAIHREKPIFIANLGMCILNFSIVVGILLFS